MSHTLAQLRANGATIADEDLARVSPLAFAHVIPNGTYFVRQGQAEPGEALHAPSHRQPREEV